jgi:drug/metabolite transporter (DMT)-like permease
MQWVEGDLWIAVAVLCWTAYSLLLRQRPTKRDPFARLSLITACGVVMLIPLTWIESQLVPDWRISWEGLWLAVIAAVLPGFGAYQAYSYMQQQLGAARSGVVLYLGPLYAGVMGWLLLEQSIEGFHLLGAALILPGVYLVTMRKAAA